jgi:LacI family transcriptional regulator
MQKEVTIYDLARHLNISVATVSRALNDEPVVSKKTKKKIDDLAREMGYRHNRFASNLRKQRTRTIGLLVPKLHSSFIASVISGVEKVAADSGYDIIISNSAESYQRECHNAESLFHKRVDGLLACLAQDTANIDHYKIFNEKNIPVVFFDRVAKNIDTVNVVIDNYRAGYLATQHLLQQGCKRLAILTGNPEVNVYKERLKGYTDALYDNKMHSSNDLVAVKDMSESCGYEFAREVLAMQPIPDGLFITNDLVAAVCMQTLKENGVRIPTDIAVVGFNNDTISRLVEPKLTTIDYPGTDMGQIAARNLINHLEGITDLRQTSTIIVRSELVVRESSLKKGA